MCLQFIVLKQLWHRVQVINRITLLALILLSILFCAQTAAYERWQYVVPQNALVTSKPSSFTNTATYLYSPAITFLPPFKLTSSNYSVEMAIARTIENIKTINFAIDIIESFARNSDASELSVPMLESAGITDIIPKNLKTYRYTISKSQVADVDQTVKIQFLIDESNEKVANVSRYLGSDNAENLTINDLSGIGLENLVLYKLKSYQTALAGAEANDSDTAENIQNIIDVVNISDSNVMVSLLHAPAGRTNRISHSVTVSGIGIVSYSYKVDDGEWCPEANITEKIEFTENGQGFHTLSVIGKDANGGWTAEKNASTFPWSLDLTPPSVAILNPPKGIIGHFSVEFWVGGEDVAFYRHRECLAGCDWSTTFPVSYPISLEALPDGPYQLAVIGMDSAGNWQDELSQKEIQWAVDKLLPTAIVASGPPEVTNRDSAVFIVRQDQGGLNIDEIKFSIDNGTTWSLQHAEDPIELSGLPEGPAVIYINGYNAAKDIWQDGLSGESITNSTEYAWSVDITPPQPTVLSVEVSQPPSSSATLMWHATEDNLNQYHIYYSEFPITLETLSDTVELFTDIPPGETGTTEVYRIEGLDTGRTYHYAVTVEDRAGNVSAPSNTPKLTTSSTRPFITGFHLDDGSSIADNSVNHELIIDGTGFLDQPENNIVRFVTQTGGFQVYGKEGNTTRLSVDVPQGIWPGNYQLKIVNANGISPLSETVYTVESSPELLPEVRSISPVSGTNDSDLSVTISGNNLNNVNSISLVSIDSSDRIDLAGIVEVDEHNLTAYIPMGSANNIYTLVIETENGICSNSLARFDIIDTVHLETQQQPVNTTQGIDLPQSGGTGVNTTLCSDDRIEIPATTPIPIKVEVQIISGAEFEQQHSDGSWNDYTGIINPPRPLPPTQEMISALGNNIVAFTMGTDADLRTKNKQPMFVKMKVALPTGLMDPVVYYIPAQGRPEAAGISGEWVGFPLEPGGTVIGSPRYDIPEPGYTTFTLGLLLDHMSVYAVQGMPEAASRMDTGGGCFISITDINMNPRLWAVYIFCFIFTIALLLVNRVLFQQKT